MFTWAFSICFTNAQVAAPWPLCKLPLSGLTAVLKDGKNFLTRRFAQRQVFSIQNNTARKKSLRNKLLSLNWFPTVFPPRMVKGVETTNTFTWSRGLGQGTPPPPDLCAAEATLYKETFKCLHPVTAAMESYDDRLLSFIGRWPMNRTKATPEQIARAGFFCLGKRFVAFYSKLFCFSWQFSATNVSTLWLQITFYRRFLAASSLERLLCGCLNSKVLHRWGLSERERNTVASY